jgi:dipeptidase D
MSVLENIKPERVMYYFEQLSRIPRESKNEQAVSDYLKSIGESLGLETIQDEENNVIIKKEASPGKESSEPVILQGHMDMVCAKEKGKVFNFNTDALELLIDGDFITADGTTLGADNGIAVAMAMAILEEKEAVHPKLEVLITTDEETGMGGAIHVDGGHFSGKTLINIDSEEEGIFTVSCAGGMRVKYNQPYEKVENFYDRAYELEIFGLEGGHSGIEIHKGGANSVKLMGRLLNNLKGTIGLSLLDGGEKDNAIAKMAKAVISTNADLSKDVEYIESLFKNEFRVSDPNLQISLTPCAKPEWVIDEESLKNLIDGMLLIPNGVQTMSSDIEGLVESSNNIGVLETTEEGFVFNSAVRSSVKSLKDEIVKRFFAIAELSGAKVSLHAEYPSWAYRPDSKIRDLMTEVYEDMYGKKPEIMAIHAGLETGLLSERIGDIDMISIGPEMYDVHTPKERLSISSTQRTYEFLKEVLKRI